MMLWFTADTHFDHLNIISLASRPFRDVDEMNEALIRNWNVLVKDDDIVWHLGDFCWGDPQKYLDRLNGTLYFIKGNHDKRLDITHALVTLEQKKWYPEYPEYPNITLCHYAMRSWDRSHYGTWHIFGHHHGRLEPHGLSFDVGVDCWNYKPISLEQVAKKMATLKPIVNFSRPIL